MSKRAWLGKSKKTLESISKEQIRRVEDPTLRTILIFRIEKNMTVSEISDELHYCLRHTYRLIKKAAQAAKERMN